MPIDEKMREAFYIGAAIFLDLDSEETDEVLREAGLSLERNSFRECRDAILKKFPERWKDFREIGFDL